jgi:hypothetical protein
MRMPFPMIAGMAEMIKFSKGKASGGSSIGFEHPVDKASPKQVDNKYAYRMS